MLFEVGLDALFDVWLLLLLGLLGVSIVSAGLSCGVPGEVCSSTGCVVLSLTSDCGSTDGISISGVGISFFWQESGNTNTIMTIAKTETKTIITLLFDNKSVIELWPSSSVFFFLNFFVLVPPLTCNGFPVKSE